MSSLPHDPELRAQYIRMTQPRVGARVLYVTPVLSIRSALVTEPPDGLLADLTVFTAGNKDDDWLDLHEGSKRDIRTQARLVVRRGGVHYDRYGQEPNTWHWPEDPKMAQAADRFDEEMREEQQRAKTSGHALASLYAPVEDRFRGSTGNPGSR